MKYRILIAIAFTAGITALPVAAQQDSPRRAPVTQDTSEKEDIQVPLPKGKKLVLNDGTFQIAREYSVQGDRVRYWSVERSDWEEIPSALVNWEATHKAEAEQAKNDAQLKAKIHASEVAERVKDIDVDRSLEIKPGLFLPDGVGFYGLEGKLIFQLKQNLASSKRSMGREAERILTGVPLIPSKLTMEIPGKRAALRISTAEPEFFMRPGDGREPRFRLLHLQVKGDHRQLETVSVHMTGEQTHQAKDIEIRTWTPANGVFRYTLDQRLEPGEYAFVEMTNEGTNNYIWDFAIDPPGTKTQK